MEQVTFFFKRSQLACGLALAALLVACGGGGDAAPESAGGGGATALSSFTSGAISGFGSVIVNGVRFDDSSASVVDDNGNRLSHDDLKLGAHVEVEASSIDRSAGTGTASLFRISSGLLGPVGSVDVAGGTLTVLGQAVRVSTTTVYDSGLSGGLAAVASGDVLEVHGRYDSASAAWQATRLERKTSVSAYRLRGSVAALDSSAKTFSIGSAVVNYASAASVTSSLANGVQVRVALQTTASGGQWIATRVDAGGRQASDASEAEVKGLITSWTSATQFSVDGLVVDASAASFPEGQSGVVLGAFVEVEGRISGGVLVATKVHLEDRHAEGQGEDFELHGTLSALDTTAKTFLLRGQTVSYGAVTDWRKLTEAELVNGLKIEVKASLSSDGATLLASRIQRED